MTASALRGNPKAIPTPTKDNVIEVLASLVEAFNMREGRSRNKGIRFVTANEIEDAGLPVPLPGSSGGSGVAVTGISGTAPISVTGGATPVVSLNDAGVTYAKMQETSGGHRLLGNPTNAAGPIQEVYLGSMASQDADAVAITGGLISAAGVFQKQSVDPGVMLTIPAGYSLVVAGPFDASAGDLNGTAGDMVIL